MTVGTGDHWEGDGRERKQRKRNQASRKRIRGKSSPTGNAQQPKSSDPEIRDVV